MIFPASAGMNESMDFGSRYRYVRELGKGGAGQVFLVRDTYLEKDLALKLLHEPLHEPLHESLHDASAVECVEKEFALLSELVHPRVARAHDFGYIDGRPYFTSEYVPGKILSEEAAGTELSGLLRLAMEVTEALAFLHRSEILHLDVKPSNIIVRQGGSAPGPV